MSVTQEKIHAALLACDKDGDGRLLPHEVIMAQLSLGVYLQPAERKKFDEQASAGPMDYGAATNLIKGAISGRNPHAEIEKMFAMFDINNDGTISAAELKAVLENLGEVLNGPQIETITSKFSNSDRIIYKELVAYLLD